MAVYHHKANNQKIRAAIYISTNLIHIIFILVYYDRNNTGGVNFHFEKSFQGSNHRNLFIISVYNRLVKSIPFYFIPFSVAIVPSLLLQQATLTSTTSLYNRTEDLTRTKLIDLVYILTKPSTQASHTQTRQKLSLDGRIAYVSRTYASTSSFTAIRPLNTSRAGRLLQTPLAQIIASDIYVLGPPLILICYQNETGPIHTGILLTLSSRSRGECPPLWYRISILLRTGLTMSWTLSLLFLARTLPSSNLVSWVRSDGPKSYLTQQGFST